MSSDLGFIVLKREIGIVASFVQSVRKKMPTWDYTRDIDRVHNEARTLFRWGKIGKVAHDDIYHVFWSMSKTYKVHGVHYDLEMYFYHRRTGGFLLGVFIHSGTHEMRYTLSFDNLHSGDGSVQNHQEIESTFLPNPVIQSAVSSFEKASPSPIPRSWAITPSKRRYIIQQWTTGSYKELQNSRRHLMNIEGLSRNNGYNDETFQLNRRLAQEFRNTHYRSPLVPHMYSGSTRETNRPINYKKPTTYRPKFLYRALHPPLSTALQSKMVLHDTGYMAFSRNPHISKNFGKMILRLPIDSVPRGTPWIWFKGGDPKYRRSGVVGSNSEEEEVLLPPGTIRIMGSTFVDNASQMSVYPISYTPDLSAKTIDGRTRIHRRQSRPYVEHPSHFHAIFR